MAEAGSLPPPPGLVVLERFAEVVHRDLTREIVVLHQSGGRRRARDEDRP
jgi:hypothetical protein